MQKNFFIFFMAVFLILGCTQAVRISQIKDSSNIGKEVDVNGNIKSNVSFEHFNGYYVEDSTGTILIITMNNYTFNQPVKIKGILLMNNSNEYYVSESE